MDFIKRFNPELLGRTQLPPTDPNGNCWLPPEAPFEPTKPPVDIPDFPGDATGLMDFIKLHYPELLGSNPPMRPSHG